MATSTLTLTANAQSITGSDGGCSITYEPSVTGNPIDNAFFYGFGSSAPTAWNKYGNPKEALNYDGSYGLMWVKQASRAFVITTNVA